MNTTGTVITALARGTRTKPSSAAVTRRPMRMK